MRVELVVRGIMHNVFVNPSSNLMDVGVAEAKQSHAAGAGIEMVYQASGLALFPGTSLFSVNISTTIRGICGLKSLAEVSSSRE